METLQRTANRGSISTGFDINNSVKLEDDNTEYLQRPASGSDGSRRTMTISMWLKRTEIDDDQIFISQGSNIRFRFKPNYFHIRLTDGSSTYEIEDENRLFRDSNAWYHLVVAIDTTQSTASDRVKIYWNGVQHTSFTTANYPSQNDDLTLGNFSSTTMQLGWFTEGGYGFNGYFAEVHYVDGTQVAQTEFGEFDEDSGIWKPKQYTGGHGSEGFHLKFEDSSNLGLDSSGNSNNFNLNNIAAADQATDSPTNNFCTFNILVQTDNKPTISEGAMKVVGGGGNWNNAYGSLGVQNGKWYYEYKVDNTDIGGHGWSTFPDTSDDATSIQFLYDQSAVLQGASTHYYQRINGTQISNESTGFGTSAVNDIFGVFLNADDQEITFAKNGSVLSGSLSQPISLNSAFSGHFIFPCNVQYENDGGQYNFGGYTLISNTKSYNDANGYGNFVYSPVLSSVNYYAICTKNIAEFG